MTTAVARGETGRPDASIAAAAARLQAAARSKVPCLPVRDLLGINDADSAYAVQRLVANARRESGARVVGHKVGLTSLAVQAQLGVGRPDFGLLFDDMSVAAGTTVDMGRLLQPKIEAEIAFVLAADVTDPDITAVTIRSAVAYASPALEIVDSRIAGWDIAFCDTVADNASSGLFTLGAARRRLDQFEPLNTVMTMTIDGKQASAGRGSACLDDPLNALAWLARTAIEYGDPLRAGHIVLSGALGPMAVVPPGAHVSAHITGLGRVSAEFNSPFTDRSSK